MIYSFDVQKEEFGFIAQLQGDDKKLSGVGDTPWEAIEHLASFLDNMQSIQDHPEDYIGGGVGHDSL